MPNSDDNKTSSDLIRDFYLNLNNSNSSDQAVQTTTPAQFKILSQNRNESLNKLRDQYNEGNDEGTAALDMASGSQQMPFLRQIVNPMTQELSDDKVSPVAKIPAAILHGLMGGGMSPYSEASEAISNTGTVGKEIVSGVNKAMNLPFEAVNKGSELTDKFFNMMGIKLPTIGSPETDKKLGSIAREGITLYLMGKGHEAIKNHLESKYPEIKNIPKEEVPNENQNQETDSISPLKRDSSIEPTADQAKEGTTQGNGEGLNQEKAPQTLKWIEPEKKQTPDIGTNSRETDRETQNSGTLEDKLETPPISEESKEETPKNTIFTDSAYEAAKERLGAYDPNLYESGAAAGQFAKWLKDVAVIGGYHLESGLRDFGEWSKKMIDEFGDKIKPHLNKVWDEVQKQKDDYFSKNKYVKNEQFNLEDLGNTDKKAAKSLREQFTGIKNIQLVRGNRLVADIKNVVPDKLERQGMFWNKAANGDKAIIEEALKDPKFKPYQDQLRKALNLSSEAKSKLGDVNKYFNESGGVAKDVGTISDVKENYMNRIYKSEPPKDFIKTEMNQGLRQTTSHAKQRTFDTEFDAVKAGKQFATTDLAETITIHNAEMARVNTARKLADAMVDNKIATWKTDKNAPEGWTDVGTQKGAMFVDKDGKPHLINYHLFAPKGIAEGLKAITEPDFIRKIDTARKLLKYQGIVKTYDLSLSFFHHFTMLAQTLYQGAGKALWNAGHMGEMIKSSEFAQMESDFAKHTGMTTLIDANKDVARKILIDNPQGAFSKIANVGNVITSASRDFLFNKMQRYLKVMDYGGKVANWLGRHQDATDAEIVKAKTGFAKEINAAYGGLNWEAMGITKSQLSILRGVLLAPDWTISNIQLGAYALGKGTAGMAARKHLFTAMIGGMVATEGINKLITGHFTDKNDKGHLFEIEISPGVYVSLLRGGIGDMTKLGSMVAEGGPIQGAARFTQGKLAPIPRTAVGLFSGTKYSGVPIANKKDNAWKKTLKYLEYIGSNTLPMPFGVSNVADYTTSKGIKETGKQIAEHPISTALVAVGLARYSKQPKPESTEGRP